MHYYIRGNFVEPDGLMGRRAELYVERTPRGVVHVETGAVLQAVRVIESWGSYMRISSADVGWGFCPDGGECERVGMPIEVVH